MAVTTTDQFEIGTTPTLLMGSGTNYEISNVGGLDLPTVRNADINLVGDGVYAARDTLGGRTVSLDLEIWGTPGSDLMTKATAFLTAWQSTNTDVNLTYRLFGQSANRYVTGRPRRCALRWDRVAEFGYLPAVVDFFCQDPRVFLSSDNSVIVI